MTKAKPIIFSGPMVRALLDGRKCQTRRILNRARVFATPEQPAFTLKGDDMDRALQNASRFRHIEGDGWFWEADAFSWQAPARRTGWMAHIGWAAGGLLWVREAWAEHHPAGIQEGRYSIKGRAGIPGPPGAEYRVIYRADGDPLRVWHCEEYPYRAVKGPRDEIDAKHPEVCSEMPGWTPSIHMPRWASRITLEVTEVRVQRLQEISEEDAEAEGLASITKDGKTWKWGVPDRDGLPGNDDHGWHWQEWGADPRRAYATLWNRLHGPGAWERNPWVSVLTFTTHRCNIDELRRAGDGEAE